METKSLEGKWKFRKIGDSKWRNAVVPGCNYLDLLNENMISDPFKGLNESESQWVSETDWEYTRNFVLTEEELNNKRVYLTCDRLDTICDIFVNGQFIGHSENCFCRYRQDIKSYLFVGENSIRFVFYSPVNYVKEKRNACPTPINSNGLNGIVHIRKPQCHFGWDWGPNLPVSGITGSIRLEFLKGAEIIRVQVEQYHRKGLVTVDVRLRVRNYSAPVTHGWIIIRDPDGNELYSEKGRSASVRIPNPQLWWTKELSGKDKQPLYTVEARIYDDELGLIDKRIQKIGLRTIELDRSDDEYGQNFQFKLNGVPLFIKGANLIPPDSFITRFDGDKLSKLLDAVQFSNMNMIRVWGGGYYGSDELYNMCDERGILIWQDFQFACQAYPFFDDSFLENVKREVSDNVQRLVNHPSLALWCGNNEIEDMHMSWAHMKKYVDYTEKFFYHILEPEIRKYDIYTPYIPGSPIGTSHNVGVQSDNVGDTHLWGVWHGLQPMDYYRKRMTRFCSEFGFESLPDLKTIKTFAEPKDYSLSSPVFKAHQKCANGNDKMVYYIASRFNLPERFVDYIYLSQITQQECISDATEHWRRNRDRCHGAMYWQLNDCWPCCSWSGIDYYGNYKALQYKARMFNAPLSISAENVKKNGENLLKVYLINDYPHRFGVNIKVEIFDFEKGVVESYRRRITAKSCRSSYVYRIDVDELKSRYDLKRTGIRIAVNNLGSCANEKIYLFDKEKNLSLPKAKLKCKIKICDDYLDIDVSSDKFARFVKLESLNSSEPFSDNFFDIIPNVSKNVRVKRDPSLSPREQAEGIRIFSLSDIRPSKDIISNSFNKYKVFLSPLNISNAIYHGRVPKDNKNTKAK